MPEKLNIGTNIGRAAIKAACAERTRQQYAQRESAKVQAQAPRPDDAVVTDALKSGREGMPARRELVEAAFQGKQPKSEHFSIAPQGDPAAKLAAEYFPDLFASAPQQPAEAASEPSPDTPPVAAPVTPQAAPEAPLPQTTQQLFETINATVNTVTAAPTPTPEAQIRTAWRELGDSARAAVVAKIEQESYGLPGYLQTHSPDVLQRLVVSELAVRLNDAKRLQPEFDLQDLLKGMGAA